MSWDLATYYNHYTSLRSTELTPPLGAYANNLRAHGYGAELSVLWQPIDTVTLRPFYSLVVLDVKPDADSTDPDTAVTLEGSNPRHQAGLTVSWSPAPRWSVNAFARYVGELEQSAAPDSPSRIPAYAELDLRLAHAFRNRLELAIVGQNLLDDRHPEFGAKDSRGELQRGAFVELRWNW